MPPTIITRKAYSYIRFSTPKKEKGDSFRGQLEATKNYERLLKNETRLKS